MPVEALFDQAGRALLILGAEGSGKTTVLLSSPEA
jgi:ABC-type Fe3+/spermidine/putrescine transport system ATPase subunit